MKRIFQFAAVAVVLLLAVQPALAGVACASSGMSRAACPMGMSEMGADCPMAYGLLADCSQDCCNHSAPKAMLLPATPAKPNLLLAPIAVSPAAELDHALAALPGWLPAMAATSSPPPYLLNCVFRI